MYKSIEHNASIIGKDFSIGTAKYLFMCLKTTKCTHFTAIQYYTILDNRYVLGATKIIRITWLNLVLKGRLRLDAVM